MLLSHLRLQTHCLAQQREFYTRTLGLELVGETPRAATIRAGTTMLEFVRVDDGSEPFYHVAFNIPQNKFESAARWIRDRRPLLRDPDGRETLFFESWNAHSFYFHDPARNILEFIARHTLPNAAAGSFTASDVLNASEIGLVARDPQAVATALMRTFRLEPYTGTTFFIGDAHGLFVIPTLDYLWIPERLQPAAVFPTEIILAGDGSEELTFDDLPYRIRSAATRVNQ